MGRGLGVDKECDLPLVCLIRAIDHSFKTYKSSLSALTLSSPRDPTLSGGRKEGEDVSAPTASYPAPSQGRVKFSSAPPPR